MFRRKILAITGLGSALAATIAVAVLFSSPTSRSSVKADTIFAGLQAALGQAFKLTLSNISTDGVTANGTFIVGSTSNNSPGAGHAGDTENVYGELTLQGDAGGDNAGLDIATTFCALNHQTWAFLRMDQLPAAMTDGNPVIAALAIIARNGVLLDNLDSLSGDGVAVPPQPQHTTSTSVPLGRNGMITTTTSTSTQTSVRGNSSLTFSFGTVGANEDAEAVKQRMIQQMRDGDANSNAANGLQLALLGNQGEAGELAARLIRGQATAADFARIGTLLQESAGSVSVTETTPGIHLLTASDFRQPDAGSNSAGGETIGLGPNAVLRIEYRENDGIQYAEVTNVGAQNGTIRFERCQFDANDARFDKTRFSSQPGVRRLDVNDWTTVFNLLGAGETNSGNGP